MYRPIGCTCNRKYEGDPHQATCLYASYGLYSKPIVLKLERSTRCKWCKTDAHSDWCDGLKARRWNESQ